ncbi:hypothetical protein D3C77_556820 [compost metagenome]
MMDDGTRNLRQAPIRIGKDRNGDIFDLRIRVRGVAHDSLYTLWHSHHPQQHVHVVNAMVERAAAPFLLPGSAPP